MLLTANEWRNFTRNYRSTECAMSAPPYTTASPAAAWPPACIKSSTEGDKYLDLITYFYDDAYDYEYYEYNVLYSLMLNMRKDIHI